MFKNVRHGACICPGDRRERSPGQERWSRVSAGQNRPRGHWDRRFKVPTGPRKSAHSHRMVTAARVQSTTPTHLVQCTAWMAAPNCPSCSIDAFCESPQLQILQGRAKLDMNAAAASLSPTPSRRCSIVMRCRSGRTDVRHTRKWSQIHACTGPDAVWGAVCALECVA